MNFNNLLSSINLQGLAVTFVSEESDAKILNEVQERFDVNITELPDEIELSSYIEGRWNGREKVSKRHYYAKLPILQPFIWKSGIRTKVLF